MLRSETTTLRRLHIFWVLFIHLLLTHVCEGRFDLVGSSQPVVATLGDDVVLPCQLSPVEDATAMTLEWTRPDLDPRFVFVWRTGQELKSKKHRAFEGRTWLFTDELQNGNISLRLSQVQLSDEGTYRCFIPAQEKQTFVELLVASNAATAPILTPAGLDEGGVELECRSGGWYPEPELLWLDAEGNLLPAGPTETVRGSDDLYTVSSRVTVDKRHSSNITCRVQQTTTNQSRQTHIHVPEDFFNIQATSSAMTQAFAVSLSLCIVFLLSLVWMLLNVIKSRRRHRGQSDKRGRRSLEYGSNDEDEILIMTDKSLNKAQTSADLQTLEEAEKRICDLKQQLEARKQELVKKPAELQQLREKIKTSEKELEKQQQQVASIRANPPSWLSWASTKEAHLRREKEAETRVESLKKELQHQQKHLEAQSKQFDDQQSNIITVVQDVIQLMKRNTEELKATENELNTKTENLTQTKRHVDQLLIEVEQLKQDKLKSESQLQQLQKQLETNK